MSEDAHESNNGSDVEIEYDHISPIRNQLSYLTGLAMEADAWIVKSDLPRSLATISKLHQVVKEVVWDIAVEIGRRSNR